MSICLKGGRVIDPANKLDKRIDLYIEDGVVLALGKAPPGTKIDSTVDVSGKYILPGLVDLGAHLREPGYEFKGTISSELSAAVAGGFTSVCCTPDTRPVIDNGSVVEHIRQRANRERSARVFCLGALTANLDGQILAEMAALRDSGCIAVTNLNQAISDTSVLRQALAYASSCELKVFLHPYEHWLSRDGEMHEGDTSTRLGLPGIPAAAELIALQRDLILVQETGVEAHFCRLSCAQSVQLIAAAKRRGLAVTADVALANLLFVDTDIKGFDSCFRVDPPIRSRKDKTRLLTGVKQTAIDAITSNHAPHDTDAKLAPFSQSEPGMSFFDTFLSSIFELVDAGRLEASTAVAAVSTFPSRILGIEGGELGKGARADLCVYDPTRPWIADAEAIKSAGKNSPHFGRQFGGKVVLTMVNGRTVYNEID
ncbi:MAG: dihydroorotase [Gammaproteobacteria bacterium]